MIVVAIIGILSAVAYPSYQNYVRKSRRADAHALLQAAQVAEEKWRVGHLAYTSTVTNLTGACYASPCYSADRYYALAISNNTGTNFTLTANAQAGTTQIKDTGCTAITITQDATTGVSYGPTNKCWNK